MTQESSARSRARERDASILLLWHEMEEEERRKGSLDSPLDFSDRNASMRSSMGDDGILTAIGGSSNEGGDGGGASRTSEETDENDEDEDEDEDVEMTTYRATYDISKRSAREGGLSGEEEDEEGGKQFASLEEKITNEEWWESAEMRDENANAAPESAAQPEAATVVT